VNRTTLRTALTLAITAGQIATANAAGDPEIGRQLAKMWCASCHLVSSEQDTAAEAPPFESIARESRGEFAWLEPFLADPHPPMPELSLTREEIRDLAAYIESLALN
jgi:mono/diheme cytochrome c family protein